MELKDRLKTIRENGHTEHMVDPLAYNDEVREAWKPTWVRNAARAYQAVERRYLEKGNCDLSTVEKLEKPAIILGSGPSLDDMMPLLHEWDGAIFCSSSQLMVCARYGIEPDYCMIIDADPKMEYLVDDWIEVTGGQAKTKLITHVQINRNYIDNWPNDVYFFRLRDNADDFSEKHLPMLYAMLNEPVDGEPPKDLGVHTYVMNSGNVVNTLIPVMHSIFHCAPIFLCGYDLGYPDGVYRFQDWRLEGGEWVKEDRVMVPEDRPVYEGNNGVTTDELSAFYKYSFMMQYGMGNPPLISCSRGILTELPYAHPREVIATQGKLTPDPPPVQYEMAREYLKQRNIYVIRSPVGFEMRNLHNKGFFDRTHFRFKAWLFHKRWYWKFFFFVKRFQQKTTCLFRGHEWEGKMCTRCGRERDVSG